MLDAKHGPTRPVSLYFIAYWSVDEADLFTQVRSVREGISTVEAKKRLRSAPRDIGNQFVNDFTLLLRQFRSPIILILLGAALLSMALGETVDAIIVIAIVFLSGALGFYQERGAVRAIDALVGSVSVFADVLRDGKEVEVLASEVVSGDVVVLRAGDIIPGDGRILSANQLYLNESALTGENYPRRKTPGVVAEDSRLPERTNCLFLGTHVASGGGTALIINTGAETEFGKVEAHVAQQHVPTSFERGITEFGYLLMQATAVLVVAIFVLNIVFHRAVIDSLLFSLALAVGLTPQMLPAIVTLSLSRGAVVMAKKRVIVKRLDAIEDVGSLDILCTDKTGTISVGSVGLHGALGPDGLSDERVHGLAWINASFQSGYTNPIDDAIIASSGFTKLEARMLGEIPFDFHRKRVTVWAEFTDGQLLISKGAVESIWSCCTDVLFRNGTRHPLSDDIDTLRRTYEELSSTGLRTLAVAQRRVDSTHSLGISSESEMTFVGFLTFADPPKPGTKESLDVLASMGVSLRLITGDNAHAAAYIAHAVGIDVHGLLTGAAIGAMSDEELLETVDHVHVFAETDPIDKERIVRAYSRRGHTVGFLGDGINDSPALHAADVGISVDTAVDVAKQTADLVLLDKDLMVLAAGIEQGRRVFANTLKYVNVTTSANFGNMLSLAMASMFLPFLPLLPFQILLLNFMSDIPGMTIATDRVDHEQLRHPQKWDTRRVRTFMVVFGLVSTVFDMVTFATLRLAFTSTETMLRSGWFVESTLTELAVMLVLRTRRTSWRSRPSNALLGTSIVVAVITFSLPYTPVASDLGMEGLPLRVIVSLVAITLVYILITEAIKKKHPNLLFSFDASLIRDQHAKAKPLQKT